MYIEHLRIPVGVGTLHVERVGRGDRPVVLLHGFGTCAFLWRAVSPTLAEHGLTAIAVDLLGYGESDRGVDAGYGVVAQAEHLDHALTALRIPRAPVVGQDMGGLVATQLAARRPDRVDGVLLINPPDPADLPGPEIRALQRTAARAAFSAHSLFGAAPLLTPLLREAVANPDRMPDLLVARYLAPFIGQDGVEQLLLQAGSLELTDGDLAKLLEARARMLIVVGEKAPWTDAETVGQLAQALGGKSAAPVISVPGAGHLIPEDAPEELARIILEWIPTPADSAA